MNFIPISQDVAYLRLDNYKLIESRFLCGFFSFSSARLDALLGHQEKALGYNMGEITSSICHMKVQL